MSGNLNDSKKKHGNFVLLLVLRYTVIMRKLCDDIL